MNLKLVISTISTILAINVNVWSQTWITYNQSNSGLPSNRIQCVYADTSGNTWFGTDNGLVRFNGTDWTTTQVTGEQQDLASNNIQDIAYEVTTYGPELWLATDNGVSVVGIEVDGLTMATPYRTDNRDLISNTVLSVAVDAEHQRWFGTDAGVSMFNGENNTWHAFSDSIPNFPVVDIGIDNGGGWRYFCTQGGGVGRLHIEVDGITAASAYDSDWSGLMSDDVSTIYVYENGDQWFGCSESASFHDTTLTKEQWQVFFQYNGLASDDIRVVTVDLQQNVWFGTPEGVSKYDWANFTTYSTADGLASNHILDIAAAPDGSLWFATDNGVTHYNPTVDVHPEQPAVLAGDFTLLPNYPNPFNPSTTLLFRLSNAAYVTIDIVDVHGRIIRHLIREDRPAGSHDVLWDGRTDQGMHAATGVYVVSIQVAGQGYQSRQSRKIVMMK